MAVLMGLGGMIAITVPHAVAADSPTGRRSDDRDSDLIDALVDAGRFRVAESICQRNLQQAAGRGTGVQQPLKWAIRLSAVRSAELRDAASDDEQAWARAAQPVADLIARYNNEPEAIWLRLQQLLVDLARGEVRAIRSIANPADQAGLQSAEDSLRLASSGLRELDDRLDSEIPRATVANTDDRPTANLDDLVRLREVVRRRIVDSLLLRARLYAADSDDALAAATEAETAAERLVESTAFDSTGREAAVRSLAHARRAAQNPKAAVELLDPWVSEKRYSNPDTLAQWVMAEMQRGNNDSARQTFASYYGNAPAEAPKSTEMDLARLRFLISDLDGPSAVSTDSTPAENRDQIAQWVEMIGQRGGPFAKRMAEIEMLRALRDRPSEGNITLMVAQAGQLIRGATSDRGADDLLRAAVLLEDASTMAMQAENVDDAFRFGLQAAAARAKAGQVEQAASQFAAVSSRFPNQNDAARLHFQAARMLSQQAGQSDTSTAIRLAEKIEPLLLTQISTWPDSDQATAARQWLMRIYEASKRYEDAAKLAVRLPSGSLLWEAAIGESGQLWRTAIAALETPALRSDAGRRGAQYLSEVATALASQSRPDESVEKSSADAQTTEDGTAGDPRMAVAATGEANLLLALTVPRQQIDSLWIAPPAPVAPQASAKLGDLAEFAADLQRVRARSTDPLQVALAIPRTRDSQRIVDLALERLRADGQEDQDFRSVAGKAIVRIADGRVPDEIAGQMTLAVGIAWNGDWVEASSRFDALAAKAKSSGAAGIRAAEILRDGATVLGALSDEKAKRRAIESWNRLAAGLRRGTEEWHQAKLGAAELMADVGNVDEAAKLARYVLLTNPPEDPSLAARYQQVLATEAPVRAQSRSDGARARNRNEPR
jgi:hypothetical protein